MKTFLTGLLMVALLSVSVCAFANKPDNGSSGDQKDYLNSIKLTFLSWISGSTKLSYERAFPAWKQSGEWCASFIKAGYDKYDNDPLGFTVRYGHKFFLRKDDKLSLKGFYLRPEAMYSHYYYTPSSGGVGRWRTWVRF